MNNVYDNGYALLGQTKNLIEMIENNINKGSIDDETITELLKEIKLYDENSLLYVNYENGMGFIVEEFKEDAIIRGN